LDGASNASTPPRSLIDLEGLVLIDIIGYTDHSTIARTAVACKSVRVSVELIAGKVARLVFPGSGIPALQGCSHCLRNARLAESDKLFYPSFFDYDVRRFAINWLWQISTHKQLLDLPRQLVHRVIYVMDHLFLHRRGLIDQYLAPSRSWRSCNQGSLVVSAILAEAISLWRPPIEVNKSTCAMLAALGDVAMLEGGLDRSLRHKCFQGEDDYWTCFMVGLLKKFDSLGDHIYGDIHQVRLVVRRIYGSWFCKETALCHINRIAAAAGLSDRAEAAAVLLWEISLEDCKLQCFDPDVRVAACALVACMEDMRLFQEDLRPEDRRRAIDVIRVAGSPTGTGSKVWRSPGVRTCASALLSLVEALRADDHECPVDLDWSPAHRRWKNDENRHPFVMRDYLPEPPHTGLRANLQAFRNKYVGTPLSSRSYSLRERVASVWQEWARPRGGRDALEDLRWQLVGMHLRRSVWPHFRLQARFCRSRKNARQNDLRRI